MGAATAPNLDWHAESLFNEPPVYRSPVFWPIPADDCLDDARPWWRRLWDWAWGY